MTDSEIERTDDRAAFVRRDSMTYHLFLCPLKIYTVVSSQPPKTATVTELGATAAQPTVSNFGCHCICGQVI